MDSETFLSRASQNFHLQSVRVNPEFPVYKDCITLAKRAALTFPLFFFTILFYFILFLISSFAPSFADEKTRNEILFGRLSRIRQTFRIPQV